ncbi:hypothetical protein CO165_03535 [Candidatus Roizmanbacteria bacterium CG_4_9_14_3_um_filter_33_18]|uniref:PIN domain-containing protein n=2 Tax=Candidatus Roizmaniibacteriota TaxID=1752723 RepID=A0A2H0KJT9_9BACT|nr:MAG: hypothetical protein COV87_02975 [Candidatus Roizmanbacteria bacterium CG11_big_fil_rev_8_21_14_0_20_37_16]PJA55437.1 MAG: hypothetical protein CO165_03535 [Candidatus Roizmanbacteria bacterium CG_4_9_14_3_um_filter_33_18]
MLKIILDANIIISAFVFEGKIRNVFDSVAINHELCFSHLLPLKHWKKTILISPANFLIKKL